jgi:mannitol-specific phosphotransferase system IIBC component
MAAILSVAYASLYKKAVALFLLLHKKKKPTHLKNKKPKKPKKKKKKNKKKKKKKKQKKT